MFHTKRIIIQSESCDQGSFVPVEKSMYGQTPIIRLSISPSSPTPTTFKWQVKIHSIRLTLNQHFKANQSWLIYKNNHRGCRIWVENPSYSQTSTTFIFALHLSHRHSELPTTLKIYIPTDLKKKQRASNKTQPQAAQLFTEARTKPSIKAPRLARIRPRERTSSESAEGERAKESGWSPGRRYCLCRQARVHINSSQCPGDFPGGHRTGHGLARGAMRILPTASVYLSEAG